MHRSILTWLGKDHFDQRCRRCVARQDDGGRDRASTGVGLALVSHVHGQSANMGLTVATPVAAAATWTHVDHACAMCEFTSAGTHAVQNTEDSTVRLILASVSSGGNPSTLARDGSNPNQLGLCRCCLSQLERSWAKVEVDGGSLALLQHTTPSVYRHAEVASPHHPVQTSSSSTDRSITRTTLRDQAS